MMNKEATAQVHFVEDLEVRRNATYLPGPTTLALGEEGGGTAW